MKKPILLELFAGTRSIGKIAEKHGFEVYSLEIDSSFGCNLTMDILEFNINFFMENHGVPDFIWASPDCTTFSMAAISHHRKNGVATSDKAILGDKLLNKTISIINECLKYNPNLKYFIENPVAMMRKQPNLLNFLEQNDGKIDKVCYCKYGLDIMKPTDLFNNHNGFIPKSCKNFKYDKEGEVIDRHCHHESARRGSQTGTQGKKGSKLRSVIPEQLCEEIILSLI